MRVIVRDTTTNEVLRAEVPSPPATLHGAVTIMSAPKG